MACNNGQDVVVDVLLQHKAAVNPLNNKAQTPLHYASWSHHGALCMELLVKAGADPNMQVMLLLAVCSPEFTSKCSNDFNLLVFLR